MKKLKGGGIVGNIVYSIIKFIFIAVLSIALFCVLSVVLIIAMVFYGWYMLLNQVLLGTNLTIDGINTTIKPIVNAGFVFINGIITGINEVIIAVNTTGEFFDGPMIPNASSQLQEKVVTFGTDIGSKLTNLFTH